MIELNSNNPVVSLARIGKLLSPIKEIEEKSFVAMYLYCEKKVEVKSENS